ncbi:translation initiation factor IF-2 subunit alpha [Candidatus Woesearchaeota archaeon]|nr:MAG: translation initiation factor IF-2 subunit alpha [Candidatus Woesearchaeota archaeon]
MQGMLLKKSGYPEENEIVLCTVTAVKYTSVFVKVNFYDKSGMIHISEISPGRIRNIRDYVKEGKVIVCKVLSVNKEKGHIDLSLRRVNETQRRAKMEEVRQEQKAQKIVEFVAEKLKMTARELYDKLSEKILEEYDSLYNCFSDVVAGEVTLKELGVDPMIADEITDVVMQRVKLPEVELKGEFKLSTYDPDGVGIIKEALAQATKINKDAKITYVGGGRYDVVLYSQDYKSAEKMLEKMSTAVIDFMESKGGQASFQKIESK